ncbi:MAG: sodium:proton exchanger [bacterium (Candidatus Stahlbacteria) CG23_combo_of_CG06-09_8_20_14_all_34_7]|nr:MAG: sodium:proton exchanger [bacterium (Candidatus Stahlbacteria) CG23_combo_of_CG06-09_8_20_14_all_34_7]
MNTFLQIFIFIVSFPIILKAADLLISGASSFAKRINVSNITIGLTIVAFGTSMPEFVINLYSSITGHNEIVFGNVIGSNIFNILLILGVSGLINPIKVHKNTTWKEIPFTLFTSILLIVLVNDIFIDNGTQNVLSRIDGIVLLIFFVIFIIYTIKIAKVHSLESSDIKEISVLKAALFMVLGIVGLAIGGWMLTESAVFLSRQIGISEKFISLTIIAAGTGIPELATSLVAIYKKNSDTAVGNIIGSNIFNVLFILGVGSIIKDASFLTVMNIDLMIMTIATLMLFVTMFVVKKHTIEKKQAFVFLISYIVYTIYLIIRR